jgi:hypothetical protein
MAEDQVATEVAETTEDVSNQTQEENTEEFNAESFIEELDKEETETKVDYSQPIQIHPLEELAQNNPLVDAMVKWAQSNPNGDFEDFASNIGYNNTSSIGDLIELEMIELGNSLHLSKNEIEELVEEKKLEYSEMMGTKKKVFEAQMLKKIKPKQGAYQEYSKKLSESQQQRIKEIQERDQIEKASFDALLTKIKSIVGTKYLNLVEVDPKDEQEIVQLAIRYSASNAVVDKGKLKGYNIDSIVQDALRKKYDKEAMKVLAKQKVVQGKVEEIKKQVRPSAGEDKGTQFAGGQTNQEKLRAWAKK